ncbi:MAG: hypothetical protein CMB99_01375 [Flavobacteriaceae bacterium]|nr:hypothetical protein [Flavobacteriaceae bacterium]|tara:strand:- start:534 stop:1052 length:519 start_codon:yes stop_codon:yes gene_type:complete
METTGSSIGPEGRKGGGGIPVAPASPSPSEAAVVSPLGSPANDDKGAGGVLADHEFTLDYTDSRGHRWHGVFRCHILTIAERARVGLTRSNLAGGISPASLDGDTLFNLEMQAWLAIALDQAPDWAADLRSLRDVRLLGSIYEEVAQHEARFWGADPGGTGGADGGGAQVGG